MSAKNIVLLGAMSGTSLDGLDLCLVKFKESESGYSYEILKNNTLRYPDDLVHSLSRSHEASSLELIKISNYLGYFIGEQCRSFISGTEIPLAIASHGHTVFHQPDEKLSLQIGSGACIAASSGIDCICDFRTADVAIGGQGAPLVPIGDKYLFPDYDACLNIGGFANISLRNKGIYKAYDICAANIVLNKIARSIGLEMDENGSISRNSAVCNQLLDKLEKHGFYKIQGAKSLGREWAETEIMPLLFASGLPADRLLATFTEHAARQIAAETSKAGGRVLVTGGGALNSYLIERIAAGSASEIIIADRQLIECKEALVFAFLGLLYLQNKPNSLQEATGAPAPSIGGALYKAYRQH
jgi:anhydro-N-acetylmuramic acid kinase